MELLGQLDRFAAVLGFADDLEARLGFEQVAQRLPQDGVVVGDQDSDDLPDG